jgi:hypothetical protein
MNWIPRFLLPLLFFALPGYTQQSDAFASDPAAAVPLVRAAYHAEVWRPNSTNIHTVEYFRESPRKFLIVTFHRREGGTSKPYLYEGVPLNLWKEWRDASSAGTWYNANLKGRFEFRAAGY